MAEDMVSVKMSERDWLILRVNLLTAAMDARMLSEQTDDVQEKEMYLNSRKEMLSARGEIIRQVWPRDEDN